MTSSPQKDKNTKINSIKRKIHEDFIKKYERLSRRYNSNIINNIIYNDKAHIVALFKDMLIMDDTGDFLKRYYHLNESYIRLPRFFEYYNLYSKIFPNYICFPEGKYFYQNILKKQKVIDSLEKNEIERRKKKSNENDNNENYKL
jgi:hypothetical protein